MNLKYTCRTTGDDTYCFQSLFFHIYSLHFSFGNKEAELPWRHCKDIHMQAQPTQWNVSVSSPALFLLCAISEQPASPLGQDWVS